jgi:anthranilate synthase
MQEAPMPLIASTEVPSPSAPPRARSSEVAYQTRRGIRVSRATTKPAFAKGLDRFRRDLDRHRGIYLSSGYEYPGRYSRWDIVAVRPPLELVSFQREVTFRPLNDRGIAINKMLARVLYDHPHWADFREENGTLHGTLKPMPAIFPEEERSKQPSVFSILRALTQEFRNQADDKLAFAGAFGYDLLFQFEPIALRLPRDARKDLQLFLFDDIIYMDRKREQIERFTWEFDFDGLTTRGLPRTGEAVARARKRKPGPIVSDHTPEEYMANVETVREGMRQGDFYEVVLRQTFSTPYSGKASELFELMQRANPSPYEFLIQFGEEQLIGASPEMFVRVEGDLVETCPISGTARRTGDPLQDEKNIRALLNSTKEESELTMCTDVDRNDKSRVCRPGTVQVIARRLIESYAGLFHTVDHVTGRLEPGFDSLDAFLSHMWAVTLIGAPKKAAANAIERLEKTARGWYGGAVGMLSLNGDINTGILIRTTYLRDGHATYPAGATLLYDSDPASEELETRLKATGFFRLLGTKPAAPAHASAAEPLRRKLLLIDNDDCFIHTLANYARQAGAEVVTYRAGVPLEVLDQVHPDLILISPGPGRPADFGVPALVRHAAELGIPVFGVCLGLQGVVEAFGGELGVLPYPVHGKPSLVRHRGAGVFGGLPDAIEVGRYHSLYAIPERLPDCLEVTAQTDDGIIMGVRHRDLPIEAVQFHPESILTAQDDTGLKLMRNALRLARIS